MRLLVAGAAFLGFAALLCAQDAGKLEFEVASVKPAELPANGFIRLTPPGGPGTADPTHINYTFTTLRNLLMIAYNVKTYQINGPAWLDTERYEVKATLAPGTTKEQEALMMQSLLAERFKVKVHHETKDLPFYELTVARGGLKMKPYVEKPDDFKLPAPGEPLPPPPPPGKDGMPKVPVGGTFITMTNGKLHMMSRKVDMPQVAGILSDNLRSQVVDKTGVKGDFDFDVEFSTEGLAGAPVFLGGGPGGPGPGPGPGIGPGVGPGASNSGDAPALITAVQEQLGLKLEQKKGPLDLIVVDHADKTPAEN